MRLYRFAANIFLERFNDDAVFLVAEQNMMVTVNHAAAGLYEKAFKELGREPFTRHDCHAFLLKHFDLEAEAAVREMRLSLAFALRQALVERVAPINSGLSLEKSFAE